MSDIDEIAAICANFGISLPVTISDEQSTTATAAVFFIAAAAIKEHWSCRNCARIAAESEEFAEFSAITSIFRNVPWTVSYRPI